MTPHHDSAAWLEIIRVRHNWHHGLFAPGWYVRRTCDCHRGAIVSVRFATSAEAERCRRALDDDCSRTLAKQVRES